LFEKKMEGKHEKEKGEYDLVDEVSFEVVGSIAASMLDGLVGETIFRLVISAITAIF